MNIAERELIEMLLKVSDATEDYADYILNRGPEHMTDRAVEVGVALTLTCAGAKLSLDNGYGSMSQASMSAAFVICTEVIRRLIDVAVFAETAEEDEILQKVIVELRRRGEPPLSGVETKGSA